MTPALQTELEKAKEEYFKSAPRYKDYSDGQIDWIVLSVRHSEAATKAMLVCNIIQKIQAQEGGS